jgi:hypothetical protein
MIKGLPEDYRGYDSPAPTAQARTRFYSTGSCEVCGIEFKSRWHWLARFKRWFHLNAFIHEGLFQKPIKD